MIDALSIGYAIKDRHAQLDMTQAELAQVSGVSKRCLWSLELGRNPGVQLDKLTAVLNALGLDLNIVEQAPQAEMFSENQGNQNAQEQHLALMKHEEKPSPKTIDALAILTGAKNDK